MYTISKLTGKIYLNGIEIIQDDRLEEWQTMYQWQLNGGTLEEIDSTDEELLEEKRKQAILIDLGYTQRISKLMSKHNDKFIEGVINGIPYNIPSDVLEERQRLKNECNQLILDLGITDFSYRQSNLQLKK